MKKNKLAFKLIDMGLKAETLANLTESQLRLLYNKLNEGKKETKEQITQLTEPSKPLYKVGPKGGNLPPSPKGYSMKKNTDGTMSATPNEGEMKEEKKKSKKYNPWAICTASVGRDDKEKYEKCVMDVKKSIKEGKDPINLFLEEKIVSLLEKHIQPKISKKDFLQMISETETAPAKPKVPVVEPGKKPKTPFSPKPGVKPAPKAETKEQDTAEPIVKPKTPKTKPKTPFSPKPGVKPAPKAGKKSVPTWLKWDNIGLNF
jgi:hypothetical protein